MFCIRKISYIYKMKNKVNLVKDLACIDCRI